MLSQDVKAVASSNDATAVDPSLDDGHSAVAPVATTQGSPEGCYMVFDSASGGRLMLFYTQGGGEIPANAVGFWCAAPSKPIQSFKFKQSAGRVELIKGIAGGDQNRRKYFSGWCQFIKLAKQRDGKVIKFTLAQQSVPVDVYGYTKTSTQPMLLPLDEGLVDVVDLHAVAVLPKHNSQFQGIKTMEIQSFLELGNIAGAATLLN
jgi:hypothetical protein